MSFLPSLSTVFDKLRNMPHEIIGLFVFLVAMAFHWLTGRDLGPNMTAVIYATYGFLLGHGVAQAKWGDPDAGPPAGQDKGFRPVVAGMVEASRESVSSQRT
jgi:hypothetical protein